MAMFSAGPTDTATGSRGAEAFRYIRFCRESIVETQFPKRPDAIPDIFKDLITGPQGCLVCFHLLLDRCVD
jgi:hypothetical protein